jgi:hypothetical protein
VNITPDNLRKAAFQNYSAHRTNISAVLALKRLRNRGKTDRHQHNT